MIRGFKSPGKEARNPLLPGKHYYDSRSTGVLFRVSYSRCFLEGWLNPMSRAYLDRLFLGIAKLNRSKCGARWYGPLSLLLISRDCSRC
jgi:hypothetical protein